MEKLTEWKDLERENKIAIIVGVLLWAVIEMGVYSEAKRYAQIQQNVAKTEMVKGR